MISIIITAYKEKNTIAKAIKALAKQKITGKSEIMVVAADDETLAEAWKLKKEFKNIVLFKDEGKGKPAALNLAVSKANGDILVLTDGDVHVGDYSITPLLEVLEKNPRIGAVSGSPVSINPKSNKLGYWAYMLTSVANDLRKDSLRNRKRIFCSGYLFAIRKELFPKLPEELLSEDGYISAKVYECGYGIGYSERSKVYVRYPDNFSDWIKQKKRSAGGYNQIRKLIGENMRSFSSESRGAFRFMRYVSGVIELWWLVELFAARLYLWYVIYRDINLKKKSHREIWVRVESTK
jgi:cellulose synthase/poly-beta-1,6-N-acetylglucosamine synthase-like glycosyltransferase